MQEELKLCPFCEDASDVKHVDLNVYKNGHAINCITCGVMTWGYTSKEKAARAWNDRPIEDTLKARLTEALAQLETIRK